jgi:hypothetical protein
MNLPSVVEVEYFNIRSNIHIKESVTFKDFTVTPNKRAYPYSMKSIRVRLHMNKSTVEFLEFLKRKKSTDIGFCLHLLAKSKLEQFFYKLSLIFSSSIYFNDPIYMKFLDSPIFYMVRTRNYSFLFPLKIKDFEETECIFVYKEGTQQLGINGCLAEHDAFRLVNKIKQKHLHLCYLYFSLVNEQLDINLRLLSAWKYLEEYIELRGLKVKQSDIPRCIFQDIYQQTIIEKKAVVGIKENTNKIWLQISKYEEKFLRDFYNEIRNLIAHHKRDEKSWISEKKYTPQLNIRDDLKMQRALDAITPLINQFNEDLFNFKRINLRHYDIKEVTRKVIHFPKKL